MVTPGTNCIKLVWEDCDGDLHAGIWRNKENMTGQMENLNWVTTATKASDNPWRALELG